MALVEVPSVHAGGLALRVEGLGALCQVLAAAPATDRERGTLEITAGQRELLLDTYRGKGSQ